MAALYTSASCIRSASPHGRRVLAGISLHDASPHMPRQITAIEVTSGVATSCHCLAAQSPSPAYKATAHNSRQNEISSAQQQGSSKVFQQVNMSNWVVGGVSSVINGLGSFAATLPRLTEEITKMVKKSNDEKDGSDKDFSKIQVVTPLSEEPAQKTKKLPSKRTTKAVPTNIAAVKKQQTDLPPPKGSQTFEEAMEDTYSSVTSFYDTITRPFEPKKEKKVPQPSQHNQPCPRNQPLPQQAKSVSQTEPLPESKSMPQPKPPQLEMTQWDEEDYVSLLPAKLKPSDEKAKKKGRKLFSYMPLVLPFPFNLSAAAAVKKPLVKKEFVSRSALDARTKALVINLKAASTPESRMKRLQELCAHIRQHPLSRILATKEKVIPVLLRLAEDKDKLQQELAYEALALHGYVFPLKSRGIRILTIDGGGTRGLISIQCLKKLEALTGKRVYEMFDYVCGVSTGALMAVMSCLFQYPLDEVERLYIEFSREMFTRSRVMGTGGLVWSHAFYDSEQWEKILQTQLGFKPMIEFARDPSVPKMSAVSSLVNTPHMKNFLFRNYNLPPESYSKYQGSCTNDMWEVIRASTAAPGYYEDFVCKNLVHMDGGMLMNNPTALAIHEARLMWPDESVQCVVSLGTGRYQSKKDLTEAKGLSLKEKVTKLIDSATDTEGVHNIMTDLLPPQTYFRFNPYLSEELFLDEIRQEKLDLMARDTQMYLRKNEIKLVKAVENLRQHRLPHQAALDWLRVKADKLA